MLYGDKNRSKIYVLNSDDNSISVIDRDGDNYTKMGNDIKVGGNPYSLDNDFTSHTLYVSGGDSISVIDGDNYTKMGNDIKVGDKIWKFYC